MLSTRTVRLTGAHEETRCTGDGPRSTGYRRGVDPGLYGPSSITWRLTREAALLLGGPRALLLQLAHPLVAAGVHEHSSFKADPIARLYRTLDATLGIVFGSTEEAERAAEGINRVHSFVKGTLPQAAGRFGEGHPYDASDPDLLLWVHATLIDTTLAVYPRFVSPLTPDEAEGAYQESKTAARILGVPDEALPCSLAEFRRYFAETIASDEIAVAPFQRALGIDVLYPPIRGVPKPLFARGAAITIAMLPEPVREAYGFELTAARRRTSDWSGAFVRGILPLLPRAARWMPHARRAYARVGEGP